MERLKPVVEFDPDGVWNNEVPPLIWEREREIQRVQASQPRRREVISGRCLSALPWHRCT
jgi:hypothetical protein